MARNLTRNTKVYVSSRTQVLTSGVVDLTKVTKDNTWEIKVLDGYSFSQATSTEDITINEAGSTPIRGQKTFNTAQDPVSLSITTYIRPYIANALVDAPERILWASLSGSAILTDGTNGTMVTAGAGEGVAQEATSMKVDFEESDTNELGKLVVWFNLENSTYMVDNVNLSTADIDFAIDGIAQIAWEGMGTSVTELSKANHDTIVAWTAGTSYSPSPATTSDSFLRNKLSTLKLQNNKVDTASATASGGALGVHSTTTLADTGATFVVDAYIGDYLYVLNIGTGTLDESRIILSNTATVITVDKAFSEAPVDTDAYYIIPANLHAAQEYTIAITGGNLTIENNLDFLTPEELGVVNQPLPGFAGSRAISGSITAYLDTGSYGTAALLQDTLDDINSVSNSYNFTLYIGGTAVTPKRMQVALPTAQLSVPTVNTESVIATEITFAGQGSGGIIENQDEVILTYYSA